MIGNAGNGNGSGNDGFGGGQAVEDLMRYDLLVEHALRQVVRYALARVERSGLPGGHHFYIAFDTRHDGVRMSDRLREKYPEEMTIVLQHQFWDLRVFPDRFEVGLSFGGVPERLVIPFEAITGFYDQHVQFALQFRKMTPEDNETLELSGLSTGDEVAASAPAPAKAGAKDGEKATTGAASARDAEERAGEAGAEKTGDKVVSLDAFRKKT